MNDVVVNKVQSIQRCVLRAREERQAAAGNFLSDHTRQDAAILNQAVDANIVEAVIRKGLDDLLAFAQICLARYRLGP